MEESTRVLWVDERILKEDTSTDSRCQFFRDTPRSLPLEAWPCVHNDYLDFGTL